MHRKLTSLTVLSLILACPMALAQDKQKASANGTKPAAPAVSSSMSPADRAAKQAKIRSMRDETLKRLYKTQPQARDEIAKAEGYAVVDASQRNLVLLVTSNGAGIVVDNKGGKETFLKMNKVGTGPGLGNKKFKQILIFKNRKLLEQFATVGADVSASADATFKRENGDKGMVLDGSVSFNPEMAVYQITDSGVMLQANWGGVAYLPDADLNVTNK
jgi:lipid-binding SYLF domain-containing protein